MRKLPTIFNNEDDLQQYVNLDLLNMNIPYHHRKKGKGGHYRTANTFTLNGVVMKWPDNIIFLDNARTIFIELKWLKNNLEPEQENFRLYAIKKGYTFYVVRSIEAWKTVKENEVIQ